MTEKLIQQSMLIRDTANNIYAALTSKEDLRHWWGLVNDGADGDPYRAKWIRHRQHHSRAPTNGADPPSRSAPHRCYWRYRE